MIVSMTAVPTVQPPQAPSARRSITPAEARSRAAHPTSSARRGRTDTAAAEVPAKTDGPAQAEARRRTDMPAQAEARRRTGTPSRAAARPRGGVPAQAGPPARAGEPIPRQTRRRARPEQVSCCGQRWEGAERAHCCRRTGGCGRVFDNPRLFDRHRRVRGCLDPAELGLVRADDIWRSA